jgi:Xaa-Pro aminopeptidase
VLVVKAGTVPGGEKPLNAFETLTLAPIDRRLVAAEILTPEEADWLEGYHARVARMLAPHLDDASRAWLAAATRPLGRD